MYAFDKMKISEVIELAKTDSEHPACQYILDKFKGVVHGIIKKKGYFIRGGDYDDLFQEGMWGIWKAIRDFNDEKGDFENFVKICVNRNLISAIKTSTRKKHTPLNDFVSTDRTLADNENLTMLDIFGALSDIQDSMDFDSISPEDQLILEEIQEFYKESLDKSLSKKEKEVYELYIDGNSYNKMMESLKINNPKTIDNAIQRVKRKIVEIKLNEELNKRKEI